MKFHAFVRSVQQFTCLYDLWARSVSPRARYLFFGQTFLSNENESEYYEDVIFYVGKFNGLCIVCKTVS